MCWTRADPGCAGRGSLSPGDNWPCAVGAVCTARLSHIHRPRALPLQEVEMDGDFDWHNSRRTRRCQHGCVSGFHEDSFVIAN